MMKTRSFKVLKSIIIAAVACLFYLSAPVAQAQTNAHWGFEQWGCVSQVYKSVFQPIGYTNSDIHVQSITGHVAVQPQIYGSGTALWQSAIAVYPEHQPSVQGVEYVKPPANNNSGVGNSLMFLDVKGTGNESYNEPINIQFGNPGLLVTQGNLDATITSLSSDQTHCPDMEVHLNITFTQ
jgi:hypothetical protein